jgi:hypothetical protein
MSRLSSAEPGGSTFSNSCSLPACNPTNRPMSTGVSGDPLYWANTLTHNVLLPILRPNIYIGTSFEQGPISGLLHSRSVLRIRQLAPRATCCKTTATNDETIQARCGLVPGPSKIYLPLGPVDRQRYWSRRPSERDGWMGRTLVRGTWDLSVWQESRTRPHHQSYAATPRHEQAHTVWRPLQVLLTRPRPHAPKKTRGFALISVCTSQSPTIAAPKDRGIFLFHHPATASASPRRPFGPTNRNLRREAPPALRHLTGPASRRTTELLKGRCTRRKAPSCSPDEHPWLTRPGSQCNRCYHGRCSSASPLRSCTACHHPPQACATDILRRGRPWGSSTG